MKNIGLVLAFAIIVVFAGLPNPVNADYRPPHDTSILATRNDRVQREIPGGRLFADEHTVAVLVDPGDASWNTYAANVILLKGTIAVRSYGQSVTVSAVHDEVTVTVRVDGLVKISILWYGAIEIKPLQGMAFFPGAYDRQTAVSAQANGREVIRIDSYGRINRDSWYWWNEYSDFEKWCFSYGGQYYSGSYSSNGGYDERVIEDRGYDEYGNYVVVRTYDPQVRIYYSVTYYYTSNPWWWWRPTYGYFQYVPGYGWVFVPYPVFWDYHHYYHEAPPTGRHHYGIIIKEREEQSGPRIPKENTVPYRPKEPVDSPARNDPAKYKIRRINSDEPLDRPDRVPDNGSGGKQIVPREPVEPQKPGADEPKRKEPEYAPREPNKPQSGDQPPIREPERRNPDGDKPSSPPSGGSGGQVRPKDPPGGNHNPPPNNPPPAKKEPVKKQPGKQSPKKEKQ